MLIIKKYTVGITYSRYIIQHVMCLCRAAAGQMGALSRMALLPPSLKYYGSKKKNNNKKYTYYRGRNRTLIKYKSKSIVLFTNYNCISDSYSYLIYFFVANIQKSHRKLVSFICYHTWLFVRVVM